MNAPSVEFKVGTFTLIVIMLLTYMTFKVGDFDWLHRGGYTVYAEFANLAGMDKKSKVKIAGVDAGTIEKAQLINGKVRVSLYLYKGVTIYQDAVASIQLAGMLGDKYIEIKQGSQEPFLKDGDTIAKVVEPLDMGGLAQDISRVSASISRLAGNVNEMVEPEETKQAVRETIRTLRDITVSLHAAVVRNDEKLSRTLDSLNTLTVSLAELIETNRSQIRVSLNNVSEFSSSLKSEGPLLLGNLRKASEELKDILSENRIPLKETIERVNSLTEKIEDREGVLGKLISDDRFSESVSDTIERAQKTLSAMDRFKAYLTLRGEYLSKPGDAKGFATLTVLAGPENAFSLSAVSDPLGSVVYTETSETQKRKTTFSAQYARRFTNFPPAQNTALRGGLIENKLGVGADQYLFQDRAKIFVDVWDFGRNDPDARNPRMKVGADYFVFRHLFVSAGADDVLNAKKRGAFIGGGVAIGR